MQQNHEAGVSLSAFDQYMREVKWISPLTCDEEKRLFERLAQGVNAEQARERLVESCQEMVIGLAKRFSRSSQHMDFMDFVQEGNTGLLQAIDRYDSGKGDSSFKTFAFAWIRGAMLMGHWTCERAISLPFNKMRDIRQLNVVSAQRDRKPKDLILPGTFQAFKETTIYPRANGYVKDWKVDIGDNVKEGQLLAEIETPEVDHLRARACQGRRIER